MRSCAVSIVGSGFMAEEHLKAIQTIDSMRVTGIASRNTESAQRLAELYGIGSVCHSVDELHEHANADLVIVAVPELALPEVADQVFRHEWTALLEKPVGFDLDSALAISASAASARGSVYAALNRRHYSSMQTVLTETRESAGPLLIQVSDQEDQQAARLAGQPEAVIRNWMYANSIHVIDLIRFLGRGSIADVSVSRRWEGEGTPFVCAQMTFTSGDVATYECLWNRPGPWGIAVSTEEARWEMRPVESLTRQPRGSRQRSDVALDPYDTTVKAGLRAQALEAEKATRGENSTLPTLEESLESMRLVKSIYGPYE